MNTCPTCGQAVPVLPIKKATTLLRKKRSKLRKETLLTTDVKRIFGIKEEEILDIPCTIVFGEQRYDKKDVARYIKSKKYKTQRRLSL